VIAMTSTAEALDRATDLFGPLGLDGQRRIRALLANPCEETWDDAHLIILNGRTWRTLWQAVLLVDRAFPTAGPFTDAAGRRVEGWTAVPSEFTIRRAIQLAVEGS
jgi:hypothetical protein